ncbi:hypothetical protein NDU88_004045 [Pleurodeles waltl]|uniref:Uncharacterized protein n=1 Tax=Pleurodeles waltl TaxID=8319 RepID=A0AAV7MCW4_PLEWA|nr:hypothetical protein NDU88_004045 [Pleurodeles waltl]
MAPFPAWDKVQGNEESCDGCLIASQQRRRSAYILVPMWHRQALTLEALHRCGLVKVSEELAHDSHQQMIFPGLSGILTRQEELWMFLQLSMCCIRSSNKPVSLPPPFLETPGDPPIQWNRWFDAFETNLGALGATRFRPERKKFLLLHSLGFEGTATFKHLTDVPVLQDEDLDEFQETVKKLQNKVQDTSTFSGVQT